MHTLKMILRGWFRSSLSSAISLLSLAIGLLCSTILLLFAVKEFRMAKTLGNDPNVYFVEQVAEWSATNIYWPDVNKELIADIVDKYPEVIEWTVIGQHYWWNWEYDPKPFYEKSMTISALPNFTKFITIPMEEGCLDSILAHPNAIAITRSYANRIFPGEDPIGKTISGEQIDGFETEEGEIFKESKTLVVEGIIEDSFHSFLNIRAIFSRTEDNVRTVPSDDEFSCLIKLQESILPDILMDKIASDELLSEKYDKSIRLCNISDAYFNFPNAEWALFNARNKKTLIIGLTIALVVLIISAFNYLNITLIRAPKRLKNLAGQRIMGASKTQIAKQIIAETALHVLVAFGLAMLFMTSAMELFNSFMGSDLQWQDIFLLENMFYIIALTGTLIIIPAIYLIAKFNIKKPMEIFKNPAGNKIQYLGSLTVSQMVISIILIAFGINVNQQMDYIANTIPQADHIICIQEDGTDLPPDFIAHIKNSATTTEYISGDIYPDHIVTNDKGEVYLINYAHPSYFNFFRIPIVMGRIYDSIPSEIVQVVVNKSYIKSREIEDNPIGYEFLIWEDGKKHRIVGVCEDFTTDDAKSNVPPTLFRLDERTRSEWIFNIRFQGSLEDKINEIKEVFKQYAEVDEDEEFEEAFMPKITTLADFYINLNPEVKRLRIMVEFFAFISIFLSAIGLFGLSWYTVERRHKEMALRKVHGATTGKLLLLLCKTFFIWCAIATIIALPIGYFVTQYWLNGFVYRIDNSVWILLLTALIAATVTFVTVIFQTTRAALANPAKYIKME
jgi:ABC-type antimicrobial peptide transport system permease subunit